MINMEVVNGLAIVKPESNVDEMAAMFQTNKDTTLATAAKGTLIEFDRTTENLRVHRLLEENPDCTVFFRPHAGTQIKDLDFMAVPMNEILLVKVKGE